MKDCSLVRIVASSPVAHLSGEGVVDGQPFGSILNSIVES